MRQLPPKIMMICPTCGLKYKDYFFWNTCIYCRRKANKALYNQGEIESNPRKKKYQPKFSF